MNKWAIVLIAGFTVSLTASSATVAEDVKQATGYRNMALNPNDVQGKSDKVPHATSNSEYGDMPCFAAKNVLDGEIKNQGHGPAFPSWGPDLVDDLWIRIELGDNVEVDKAVISVRADFKPYRKRDHDGYWKSGVMQFSDGSKVPFKLKKTADPQTIKFDRRKISWVKITDLVVGEGKWCGFSEVEIWGKPTK
jgi:hypothetical protein